MTGDFESSVDEAAAFWFARLRSDRVAAGDRERFMRWLNADVAHAQAYARYQGLWNDVAGAAGDESMLDLRREALALAPARAGSSWQPLVAVAAMLAILLSAGLLLLTPRPIGDAVDPVAIAEAEPPRTLRTAVGQRSTVTLEDGSIVELNTDSLVEVRYSEGRRDLRLVRGQALFEVAHDRSRPFVVEAAGQRITALGTAFDVRLDGEEMRVTLIEGSVTVEGARPARSGHPAATRTLRPGEQFVAAADRPPVVLPIDVQQQVSWRTGRLIFSDEPLGEVIGELNRYSERKIVLADASLAELRVSGVFRAGAVGSFVSAMDAGFPVSAENRGDEVILRWE